MISLGFCAIFIQHLITIQNNSLIILTNNNKKEVREQSLKFVLRVLSVKVGRFQVVKKPYIFQLKYLSQKSFILGKKIKTNK